MFSILSLSLYVAFPPSYLLPFHCLDLFVSLPFFFFFFGLCPSLNFPVQFWDNRNAFSFITRPSLGVSKLIQRQVKSLSLPLLFLEKTNLAKMKLLLKKMRAKRLPPLEDPGVSRVGFLLIMFTMMDLSQGSNIRSKFYSCVSQQVITHSCTRICTRNSLSFRSFIFVSLHTLLFHVLTIFPFLVL